jgi:hypothetical protein
MNSNRMRRSSIILLKRRITRHHACYQYLEIPMLIRENQMKKETSRPIIVHKRIWMI